MVVNKYNGSGFIGAKVTPKAQIGKYPFRTMATLAIKGGSKEPGGQNKDIIN